jgi:Na+/H+-dicarboxylate symporter
MSRTIGALAVAALIAGVLAGAGVSRLGVGALTLAAETFEYVGVLWLNALRMTVIPLVVSLLVTGIASIADAAASGRMAARAMTAFAVMLTCATLYATILSPLLLSLAPVDPQSAAALLAGAGPADQEAARGLAFGPWLASLAPSNPIAAAAEGAVLPLVVFAILFGFAATRLDPPSRTLVVGLFKAIADTMIVIVRWAMLLAPVGVFALSLGLGLRSGLGAAGALLHYIVFVSGVTAGVIVMAFAFAVIWGRRPLSDMLRASAPVLAVAFSTQSSLASLPLMVERARDALGVREHVAGMVLPLAVAVFRVTSPVANLAVVYFVCAVSGYQPDPGQMLGAAVVAVAISIGSVGLPGQISFIASVAPIALAMGAPIELLGLLLAVEVIPDIFRTLGNVSGDMAAAAIVDAGEEREGEGGAQTHA